MSAADVNLVRLLLLIFWGFALYQAARLAWAEAAYRRNPPDGGAARTLESSLENNLRNNPRLSTAWITLGIEAERAGDFPQAEAKLLEAARIDRQYLPAWTLANYYFRRGAAEKFWPWARRAADLTFDDYRPLLRLCDDFDPDPPAVIARLGGGRPVIRAYLDLLIGEKRPKEAKEVAQLLLADQRLTGN